MSTRAKKQYHKRVEIQKKFSNKIATGKIDGIRGLDHPLLCTDNKSLREILMSIKHPSQERKLFVAVHDTYGCQTSYAYKSIDISEAKNFMESLSLILAEWFNTTRTWTWFTEETFQHLEGYK